MLMLGAGLNAYALGPLKLDNSGTQDVAVECFPSKNFKNGVHPNHDEFTCAADDTVMYFGRFGASADWTTDTLDAITKFTPSFINGSDTGYHEMGDGHVWKVLKNMNEPDSNFQECEFSGVPQDTVDCAFDNS